MGGWRNRFEIKTIVDKEDYYAVTTDTRQVVANLTLAKHYPLEETTPKFYDLYDRKRDTYIRFDDHDAAYKALEQLLDNKCYG